MLYRRNDAFVADGIDDIADRCLVGARELVAVEPPDHGNVIGVCEFARPEQVRVSGRAGYLFHDHLALSELVEGEDVLPLAVLGQDLDGVVVAEDDVALWIEHIASDFVAVAHYPDRRARVDAGLYLILQPPPDGIEAIPDVYVVPVLPFRRQGVRHVCRDGRVNACLVVIRGDDEFGGRAEFGKDADDAGQVSGVQREDHRTARGLVYGRCGSPTLGDVA